MSSLPHDHDTRMARARLSLAGLSVGDALGERFFGRDSVVERAIAERTEPPAPWSWTDDTAMATCAMVGGVVAMAVDEAGIPARWLAARESLEP